MSDVTNDLIHLQYASVCIRSTAGFVSITIILTSITVTVIYKQIANHGDDEETSSGKYSYIICFFLPCVFYHTTKLKDDRPHPRDYPNMPTNYRHTDKHLRLVMTLIQP